MPEIAPADIERIAIEAAELLVVIDKDTKQEVSKRLLQACELSGDYIARLFFVKAFASRAATARHNNHMGVVSRLKDAAYRYRPTGITKKDVNKIFKETGAVGHTAPQRRIRTCSYMLRQTHMPPEIIAAPCE